MPTPELYLFKVRDSITGQWQQTRYPMSVEMARARFREGNFELLEQGREAGDGVPVKPGAAHLLNSPGN